MTGFRFRLESVLNWRRTQLEVEEGKLRREIAALGELDRLREQAGQAGVNAENQVRQWRPVTGADLAALGAFRKALETEKGRIAARRKAQAARAAAQQTALMEARRRCRLLERLKERRFEEWRIAAAKELEELASEASIAKWSREA